MATVEGWNPRYVAFAAEHGRTPEEQTEADRREYPGGVMAGFICWINERWAEWSKLRGREARTAYDHEDFDRWLATRRT